ncbi:hypothetical protein K435DRAFT_692490, partial [Dendrothele bispora CBS 962.96]
IQIFGHLEPLDILRLSRTSRDLRNLLTSRSSEHVWRNARLNVEELPSLPTDLNEIQYAKLVFDAICQVCGTHCHSVYWDCRIRCCQKCARQTCVLFCSCKFLSLLSVAQAVGLQTFTPSRAL